MCRPFRSTAGREQTGRRGLWQIERRLENRKPLDINDVAHTLRCGGMSDRREQHGGMKSSGQTERRQTDAEGCDAKHENQPPGTLALLRALATAIGDGAAVEREFEEPHLS